jgi:predicted phosphodiesterase
MEPVKKLNQFDLCYDQGHPITFMEYENIIEPKQRIILTSDLHTKGLEVFKLLNDQGYLKDTVVLCAGDMCGDGTKGTNMDAMPLYKFILSTNVSYLYFVQGNHDLFSNEQETLKNKDGSYCCLHNKSVESPVGLIGGINGIIGKDDAIHHKYAENKYIKMLDKLNDQKLDIIMTHDVPRKSNPAKLHVYGHHHQKYVWFYVNKQLTCNVDARIIFMDKTI